MAKSFHYSLGTMTRRLLKLAAPVKGQLALSTLASVVGNLAQMGLMGFGALTLLACAGWLASVGDCNGDQRRSGCGMPVYRRRGVPRGSLPSPGPSTGPAL